MSLPTNYKDDILDTSQNTKRIYDIKRRSDDGVVAQDVYLVDKTAYNQRGNSFGATDVNNITSAVNGLTIDITEIHVSQNKPVTGVEGGLYFTFS